MSTQSVNQESAILPQSSEISETRAEHVSREPNGKWLPGHCPNPNGRPKTARIKDAFEGILQDEGAEKYAQVVTGIALDAEARKADRLAAVNLIADRTEGKPLQAMLVGHTVDQSSVNLIGEMLGKLNITPALEEGDE